MVKDPGSGDREVLIEIQRVGNSVRVTAMDTATLVEVTIVGSPRETEARLKQMAVQKLRYVLGKRGHSTD
ncbi:MAG: hypothetical protein AB1781_00885 [Pseudomonadota bacterium]